MALSRMLFVISMFLHFMLAGHSLADSASVSHPPYFRITVVDQETHRGIPAVKFRILNGGQYWTDNNGVVAFYEPDLMNQKVWFTFESHGYVNENVPVGLKGIVLDIKPGGSAIVSLRRINVAQRLYRMTGSGMYRDSILLGDKVPPVPESGKVPVMGQDGGDMVLFNGRYHWIWGDTSIARFPLGIFKGTSAISDLPENGGLDPDKGVALHYLRKDDGEIRPIINLKREPGKIDWYSRIRVAKDKEGHEHLLANYVRVNSAWEAFERGLLEYSEQTGLFEFVAKYPDHPIFVTETGGSTVFRHTEKGKDYFYHPDPYPVVRYPTDYESQRDITTREAFTCLKEGYRYDGSSSQLDRDKNGNLRWGWKKNTSPVSQKQMDQLVDTGLMKNEERWYSIQDIDSGKPVFSYQGSIYWNPFRKRWICINVQIGGDTQVGEVWYLEGDTPQGPWVYARKIITHNWPGQAYSFYIPAQLPEFDKNGGRTIYIKGTFSAFFGDVKEAAPRHDYNIMVYKLELDDPRLFLPVPVYHDAAKTGTYGTRKDFDGANRALDLVWFAPDRPAPGTAPIYQIEDRNGIRLTTKAETYSKTAFYALPVADQTTASQAPGGGATGDSIGSATQQQSLNGGNVTNTVRPSAPDKGKEIASVPVTAIQTVALYQFVHANGKRTYSTNASLHLDGFTRLPEPICRVWPSPILFNPFGNLTMKVW